MVFVLIHVESFDCIALRIQINHGIPIQYTRSHGAAAAALIISTCSACRAGCLVCGSTVPKPVSVIGDVRDRQAVRAALDGVNCVFHLAATVGVGQSMYEICDYTSTNSMGTAQLLEALIEKPAPPVERLIVASSMSIYGEGLYQSDNGDVTAPADRTLDQLRRGDWEVRNASGKPLIPIPTAGAGKAGVLRIDFPATARRKDSSTSRGTSSSKNSTRTIQ